MSDAVRGMVVYHRKDYRRGKVTAGNQFTGMIAVQWDDGTKQLINVQELMSEKLYNEFKEEERISSMSLKPQEVILDAVVYQGKTAPLTKGKIVGPLSGSLAVVEWESGHISKVDIKFLFNEADGIAENQRLQDEKDRLEREFATVEIAVKEKLADAAKLVNEAAAIANKGNLDIQDMYDATRDLERAMENAGWRTSSWHC
jgi:hypothetical protein